MTISNITKRFRVDSPDKFRLAECDPNDCHGLTIDKSEAKAMLAEGLEQLVELQERLYADDRWSVLIVLQAMDAAGKDSVIKHVMSGLNPQGVEVHSFKQPSVEELNHNFLWRAAQRLPERQRALRIGIDQQTGAGAAMRMGAEMSRQCALARAALAGCEDHDVHGGRLPGLCCVAPQL